MTTVTLTKARAQLGRLCEQARKGEQIGIISGDQIFQIKPVHVVPWEETYLYKEYGVPQEEAERFAARMDQRIAEDRKEGRFKRFSGDLEKDIKD